MVDECIKWPWDPLDALWRRYAVYLGASRVFGVFEQWLTDNLRNVWISIWNTVVRTEHPVSKAQRQLVVERWGRILTADLIAVPKEEPSLKKYETASSSKGNVWKSNILRTPDRGNRSMYSRSQPIRWEGLAVLRRRGFYRVSPQKFFDGISALEVQVRKSVDSQIPNAFNQDRAGLEQLFVESFFGGKLGKWCNGFHFHWNI